MPDGGEGVLRMPKMEREIETTLVEECNTRNAVGGERKVRVYGWGLEFGVWGLGFGVKGLGFRV